MQFWRLQFCNLTGEWCDTKAYSWLCKIPDEWVAGRLSIWVFENDKKRQSYPCLHYQSILLCDGDHICETCSFVLRDLPCAFVARSTSFLFFSLPTCKLGWWNSTGRACMWQLEAQHFASPYLYPAQHFWGMLQRIGDVMNKKLSADHSELEK